MIFGLFGKKDPVCGMKEEKGKGISKHGEWFCSEACLKKFEAGERKHAEHSGHGCCGH